MTLQSQHIHALLFQWTVIGPSATMRWGSSPQQRSRRRNLQGSRRCPAQFLLGKRGAAAPWLAVFLTMYMSRGQMTTLLCTAVAGSANQAARCANAGLDLYCVFGWINASFLARESFVFATSSSPSVTVFLHCFFCGYQGLKYAAKLARKEDDFWNVLIASAGSFAPMVAIPAMRSRYPYAAILIAMDTLNNHVL